MAQSADEMPAQRTHAAAEKQHEAQVHAALERVGKLRDRFSLSVTALAVVATLMAVWVRAPTLEIELPLGEAKASFNVGYVLALGTPVIAIVYALAVGNLVTARRYQFEILNARHSKKLHPEPLLLLQLGAPSKQTDYFYRLDWVASTLSKAAIGFVLFVVPTAACGWIGYDCLTNLELFPGNPQVYGDLHCDPRGAPIDCRHVITFGEHAFGLKDAKASNAAEPTGRVEAVQFGVVNRDIETACQNEWKRMHDPKPSAAEKSSEEPLRIRCVFEEFPRFVIPLTSWSNVLFTSLTAALAAFGMLTYWRVPTIRTRAR
jgi:hypothetical protein